MAESKGTDGALSIGFLHPDLGIGGAERLVVDAAHGLAKQKGHRVTMYTSHFNKERCFAECNSGSFPTRVHGDFLPRHIAGRLHILFALLRNIWLAIRVGLSPRERHDVLVCDQISVCVPILRLLCPRSRILFYCHFPDQLLSKRESVLKKLYRVPFDLTEEVTTGMADCTLVNRYGVMGRRRGWV